MASSANDSTNDNADDKVILTQNLLRVPEVFVYRVPPMATSGGHRAEFWDLSKPVATTALSAVRRDNALFLQLVGQRPKKDASNGAAAVGLSGNVAPPVMEDYLFAQCRVNLQVNSNDSTSNSSTTNNNVEYWVEAVVDSSRYFVLRCEDPKSNRQAFVGVGFRERNDAMNFKMALSDYTRSIERERKAEEWQRQAENNTGDASAEHDSGAGESVELGVSKLSLKEGEKIHINLGGASALPKKKKKDGSGVVGAGGLLLRRPPPPAGTQANPDPPSEEKKEAGSANDAAPSSLGALSGEKAGDEDEDEDEEWGDFESG